MYLLIDAGNTRIKYAGFDVSAEADWAFHDVLPSDALTPFALPAGFEPQGVVIVSVASAAVNAYIMQQLSPWSERIVWFRSTLACADLRNGYTDPSQLGADRWAAAIGAWQRARGACLVVGAGTATTIDVISADGEFVGGCILPGLEMMQRALVQGTARLPLAEGRFESRPRNTDDAIYSGCLNAQLGAIERMRQQLPATAPVFLAGGAGLALAGGLTQPVEVRPNLVLEGLRVAVPLLLGS